MSRWLFSIFVCASAILGDFQLVVFNEVDTFGNVCPVVSGGVECLPDQSQAGCVGGFAKKKYYMDQTRPLCPNSLYIEQGGSLPGSPFYNAYGVPVQAAYWGEMGLDAFCLASRDFTSGPGNLLPYFNQSYPIIQSNSNITLQEDWKGVPLHQRVLFHFPKNPTSPLGNRPVPGLGDIGVTADYDVVALISMERSDSVLRERWENITLGDLYNSTLQQVAILTQKYGVNKIILNLGDTTTEDQLGLYRGIPGIDLMLTTDGYVLTQPYPVLVQGPGGVPVLRGGAGSSSSVGFGDALSFINLTFDDYGVLKYWNGSILYLGATVPNSPALAADIAVKYATIEPNLYKVQGVIEGFAVGGTPCRHGDCGVGWMLADAGKYITGVNIGLMNGGYIRSNLTGNITIAGVLRAFPFQDFLSVMTLTGPVLMEVLENSVSAADLTTGTGRFLQVSGLQVYWNINAPVGQRIIHVYFNDGGTWVPLDLTRSYTICIPDFERNGGDGYSMLQAIAASSIHGLVNDDFVAWLQTVTPFSYANTSMRLFPTDEFQPNPNATYPVWVVNSSGEAIAMYVLAALGLVLVFLFVVGFIVYFETKVIKAASPSFCLITLLGVTMANIDIYFWGGEPTADLCMLRIWFGGLAFCFIFSPLLIKTVRIYFLFKKSTLKIIAITDLQVLVAVTLLLIGELIILIVWQNIAPLLPTERTSTAIASNQRMVICSNTNSTAVRGMVVVFFVYKASFLVIACFLAYETRHVADVFQESRAIFFSLYNILVIGAVFLPILGTIDLSPTAFFIMVCIGILVAANGTSCILFITRFREAIYPDSTSNATTRTHAIRTSGSVRTDNSLQ